MAKKARAAATYRGARRNACIRQLHGVWGVEWYHPSHRNEPRWAIGKVPYGNQAAIYIERDAATERRLKKQGSRHDATSKQLARVIGPVRCERSSAVASQGVVDNLSTSIAYSVSE